MKKFLKWAGIVVLSLIVILFVTFRMLSDPIPEGTTGPDAEALAQKIWLATAQDAWDTTRYVSWNFDNRHQFIWDRERDLVQVDWQDYRVLLNTQTQQGKAWLKGQLLEEGKAAKKLNRAWQYFCNDSFWLNAPGKIFDPGTSRSLVKLENGDDALLVSYSSGGVTPGDSYLWLTDEQGLPHSWKMWVSILPVGGVEASWANWQQLPTGGQVATEHDLGFYQSKILDIRAGQHWESLGLSDDPFGELF